VEFRTCPNDAPHLLQNFARAGSSLPQWPQRAANGCPHSRQNFESLGFSCWHCAHCIWVGAARSVLHVERNGQASAWRRPATAYDETQGAGRPRRPPRSLRKRQDLTPRGARAPYGTAPLRACRCADRRLRPPTVCALPPISDKNPIPRRPGGRSVRSGSVQGAFPPSGGSRHDPSSRMAENPFNVRRREDEEAPCLRYFCVHPSKSAPW
jgi:hypothetical protein